MLAKQQLIEDINKLPESTVLAISAIVKEFLQNGASVALSFASDDIANKVGVPSKFTEPAPKLDWRQHKGTPIKLGGWEGKIFVPDNFNDPLDDFEDYM